MKRKSPSLTAEQRAALADRCRRMNADPEVQARRLASTRAANARRIEELRERIADARQSPMRIINLRARQKEKFADDDYRHGLSKRLKEKWADPAFVEKVKASKRTPEFRRKIARAVKRDRDRKRGYRVPSALKPEYTRLMGKGFTSGEVGKILGLI